jgi:hypothetical protein
MSIDRSRSRVVRRARILRAAAIPFVATLIAAAGSARAADEGPASRVGALAIAPGTTPDGAVSGGASAGLAAPGVAAPSSSPERLTELGKFFDLSDPPSQDFAKARDLYCRAGAAGEPEALHRLGWMYLKGRGVPASDAVAGTLFRWATALGFSGADGMARALQGAVDTPPPCLAAAGAKDVDALRARVRAARNATIENPVQLRTAPASIDQQRIVQMVLREARSFRLDPRLVLALMRTESNFDPLARSPKSAQGLMQLIPETAQRFNVQNPFDPTENVRGGMAYLRWLLAYYRGDVALTLAAYNAGEGAVDRYRGVPPFAETIAYVQRIRALYPFDRHPFDVKALASSERSWIDKGLAATTR